MDWEAATKVIFKVAQSASRKVQGYVKLGYACNNKCLFCTAEWKKRYGDRDTRTILDELVRIFGEDSVAVMVYSGGEPTLRSDLPEILEFARGLGIDEQNIQTNARKLADRRYLEHLRDAGLSSCFVSIHGPESGIHDWLTRSPGAFEETCAGISNLESLGVQFVTNTVICRQNYKLLSKMVSFLRQSFPSVCEIRFSYPRLQGGAADNLSEIIEPVWVAAPFVQEAIDTGHKIGVHVETEFMPICLLGTRYGNADVFSDARHNLSDLTFSDSNYHRRPGKVFYDVCGSCDVLRHCCGLDSLHHETFGENSSFQPVCFTDPAI